MIKFQELVSGPAQVMGVTAVFGTPRISMTCVSDENAAAKIASRAIGQPYIVAVASGSARNKDDSGRAVAVLRASGAYGRTDDFIKQEIPDFDKGRWPYGVILSEVYQIIGQPHLVNDLQMPGPHILSSQRVGVSNSPEKSERIWSALKDTKLELRIDLTPPIGFIEPEAVALINTDTKFFDPGSQEGMAKWAINKSIERSRHLRKQKLDECRTSNGGVLRCECCGFSDTLGSVFDVHHLNPLCRGSRITFLNELVIVCPTCHRLMHTKSQRLTPLSVEETRRIRQIPADRVCD